MKKSFDFVSSVIFFFWLFLFLSCGKEENGGQFEPEKPLLLSSDPSEGADDVPWGERTIVLTYDQNVVLVTPKAITLNGEPVESANAYLKKVTIKISLEKETQYRLHLPQGTVKSPTGGLSDDFTLSFTTKPAPSIKENLVTPNASEQAKKVYAFLLENYGKRIVSGSMSNVAWNAYEAEWVHSHTGKYPALNCFDYVHLYASPTNWINYEDTKVVEDWWENNGLVAAGWHWNVPSSISSTGYGFYAVGKGNGGGNDETEFDIRKAITEGTEENDIVKADLEKIADNLLLIKEKDIPVLWRPLHEASGKWFWWGAGDADSYRKLWALMFSTFKEKGLNNLIWVWTSQGGDLDWYPGDEYVDIIGCDIYKKSLSEILSLHNTLTEDFPDKMITLSEFGTVPDLSAQWNVGVKWSWMMPWYDYDRTNNPSSDAFKEGSHIHANIEYWKKVFEGDYVITRDKMPSLK